MGERKRDSGFSERVSALDRILVTRERRERPIDPDRRRGDWLDLAHRVKIGAG